MTTPPPLPEQTDYCWPVDPGCLDGAWEALTPEAQARAIGLATATLFRLTLGQVGGCMIDVRPCPVQRMPDFDIAWMRFMYPQGGWGPQLTPAGWVNCGCQIPCACTTGCEIDLPGYIGKVGHIQVGPDLIDRTQWVVIDHARIVWQGSEPCPFPKRQDLSKPIGEPDTFLVNYCAGRPVDGQGAWAAGTLANEFGKACSGDTKCRLPKNVTTIVRQGVSMNLVTGVFPNAQTGIREVDSYIALWNPLGVGTVPAVWSPDVDQAVVQT